MKPDAEEVFYMVWAEGNRAPTVKHQTVTEAEDEARRIAAQQGVGNVYVLKAITVSHKSTPPVTTAVLRG